MKKQTAVEWLYEHILLTPLDIRSINECYVQAKEMEKEQIINTYRDSRSDQQSEISTLWYNRNAEQYYKENYESNTNI